MSKSLKGLKAMSIKMLQEWFAANNETMYICVDNKILKNELLKKYEDRIGLVKLNTSTTALGSCSYSNVEMVMDMSFAGESKRIYISLDAVVGVWMPMEEDGAVKMMVLQNQDSYNFINKKININMPDRETTKLNVAPNVTKIPTDNKNNNVVVDMASFRNKKLKEKDM